MGIELQSLKSQQRGKEEGEALSVLGVQKFRFPPGSSRLKRLDWVLDRVFYFLVVWLLLFCF